MPTINAHSRCTKRRELFINNLAAVAVDLVARITQTKYRVLNGRKVGQLLIQRQTEGARAAGQLPLTMGGTHHDVCVRGVEIGNLKVGHIDRYCTVANLIDEVVGHEFCIARFGSKQYDCAHEVS